jgi:hypothetical protein
LAVHLVPERLRQEKTLEQADGHGNPVIKSVVYTKNKILE